ncbi:MAG: hypothetical protein JRI68_01885 [Deltaproteobacteria bacterium]|nr:hypothetical protein [Deltaproteobacteria bacterium]
MALALKTALKAREPSELTAGMTPDGSYRCLVLDPGQTVAVPITLQPGRCYTFLAHGFPNVIELDLRLKPNLGPNVSPTLSALGSAVLAQDNTSGPVTSIGSGKTCFKNALPIPMAARVEAIAVQGGGPVAVQSYGR